MKTFVILIAVKYNNSRKVCENIENSKYEFSDKPNLTVVRDKILKEVDDEELTNHLSVYPITDFMDDCNDQMINLENYFISYVYADQKS